MADQRFASDKSLARVEASQYIIADTEMQHSHLTFFWQTSITSILVTHWERLNPWQFK
jgi:hypothetical protein